VELRLNADHAQADSLKWIVEQLKKDRRVQEVAYNAAVVENIDANVSKVGLLVLGFTVLLLIIAIALINNTIRLAIYSKRFLIRTMHLVGATQWFIKKPFLGQSLWQGIHRGGVGHRPVGGLACNWHQALHARPARLHRHALTLAMLFAGVLVLGLLISLASTWFAVGRYLRMNSEDLHWS
jgi:cell division transport system permease protein